MPFPYPTIPRPPGDWEDPFDYQAIEMSLAHNMFIRAINAIHAQAQGIKDKQVKPFAFFCMAFCESLNHHHDIEETYTFPMYNAKLGANAMDRNIEQHEAFMGGLTDFNEYVTKVHAGATAYNAATLTEKLNSFADDLVLHLREEISTLESSRLRAAMTEKDLKDIEATTMKVLKKETSLFTGLPMDLICHDKSTEPRFPPAPKAVIWAAQYGSSWVHNDAWAFGPCDINGKLKPGLGNT
ncbi:Hemerythrin domain-containing protein [Mycena sanguinolenta]|uniref:Hemerythrin domain-containing protein n=1 Tax=Mycena sanguinolenta TaxID=230812 RepID=A0A8H7DGN6_9AGAR|nr:Hemerythrin domain-containing protein [Mycena sanguinolenta]